MCPDIRLETCELTQEPTMTNIMVSDSVYNTESDTSSWPNSQIANYLDPLLPQSNPLKWDPTIFVVPK